MEFVNLTPHELNIYEEGELVLTLPKSEDALRCIQKDVVVRKLNGITIRKVVYEDLIEPPPEADGVVYVVSLPCAKAAAAVGRKDFLAVGPAIRDDAGRIIGANGLALVD